MLAVPFINSVFDLQDLLITPKGSPSIAFVLGTNAAALHNQQAAEELASRCVHGCMPWAPALGSWKVQWKGAACARLMHMQ